MLDIRAETADAGQDRLPVIGMLADLARKREQSKRALEIKIVGRQTFRQAGALGLLTLDRLAELHVGPEPARAQRHFEAAHGILAELFHAPVRAAIGAIARRELAGVAAFGIIRAADEAAELAELEREFSGLAIRALARVGAVRARRKQMRRQHLVERVYDLRDAQLLDVADGGGEIAPEVAQQVAPGHLVV